MRYARYCRTNPRIIFIFTFLFFCLLFIPHAAFPSREAAFRHNMEGVRKLKSGDYKGAIADLKAAHRYSPSSKPILKNLAVAYNNYGFYLMSKDQLNPAIEQLENSLYYDPENPYALYNIGQAYYRVQNMPRAKLYLEKASKLEPGIKGMKPLLRKISGESEVEKGFDKIETMHFIIAAAPKISVSKISYIRTYLEEAYGRIGMFLDYYPKNKVVVILYSEDNYGKLLKHRPHWTLALFDGKVRIPVNKFKYTDEEVIKIIYHEYAHAVVYDIAKDKCPLWLNEGIAGKAESFAVPKDRELFGKYIEKLGLIPFRKIPGDFSKIKSRNTATLLYMESYLLVDFIVKKAGYSGLKDILLYLGKGADIRYAIVKVLERDVGQFEKEWERYVIENCGIEKLKYYR